MQKEVILCIFFQNKFTKKLHLLEAPIHGVFKGGAAKILLIIVRERGLNEAKLPGFLQNRNFFGQERR